MGETETPVTGANRRSWLRHSIPLVCCILVAWRWSSSTDGPLVEVEQGRLRGSTQFFKGSNGYVAYHSFKGVPYAKPPLGDLRFRAPEPPENWTDVRPALSEGPMCCQPHTEIYWLPESIPWGILAASWKRQWNMIWPLPRLMSYIMSFWGQKEDCLYLNIFTKQIPAAQDTPLSPVVVFIHGGGFFTGTANSHIYGPDSLLREDLILVTVQYRLGALGFLAPGDSTEVPGNAGLKDQVAALRWIQRNIARFGGDPSRVTMMGHSAGGASVHYHMLSPMSKGLFHRAVQLSGSAFNSWAFVSPDAARKRAFKLGALLGFQGKSSADLVAFLRTKTPNELIQATYRVFSDREHGRGYITPFVPSVEQHQTLQLWPAVENETIPINKDDTNDVFLPSYPLEIMESRNYSQVPTILGMDSMEGMIVLLPDIICEEMAPTDLNIALLNQDFERIVPAELILQRGTEASMKVAEMMRQFYFGGKDVLKQSLSKYLDVHSDLLFGLGLGRTMRLYDAVPTHDTFYYHFTFDGRLSVVKKLVRGELPGVSHGDELGYLFPVEMLPPYVIEENSMEFRVRDRFISFIANFARTGNPTPPGNTISNVTWKASNSHFPYYMEIGEELNLKEGYMKSENYEFWNSVYQSIGRDIYDRNF